MSEANSPHLSSHLGVPARSSNQLTEVTVGFANPPPFSEDIQALPETLV